LIEQGWVFNKESDKILVLSNSRIAERAGFSNLYKLFSQRFTQSVKERLLDRNHILIRLVAGYVDKKSSQERPVGLEHLLIYWNQNNHNEVIRFIKKNGTLLSEFKHYKNKIISETYIILVFWIIVGFFLCDFAFMHHQYWNVKYWFYFVYRCVLV